MVIEEPKPGLRQQRADETRARLFEAAVELFRRDGYHNTSVERIAAKAGVAKGTFFVHFPSKDAVITALVRIQTGAARKARLQALEKFGPIVALRAAVMTLGERAGVSRTLSRGVLAATLESQDVGGEASELFDQLFAEMKEDARLAKKRKMLERATDPDVLAASLMASYLGAVLHFTSSPKAPALVDILEPLINANIANAARRTRRT